MIKARRAVALLSAIATVALSGNALAAVFCPHMSGGHCCIKSVDSQPRASAGMDHNHMHQVDMSEMGMSDDAMDMSGAQPDDSASLVESEIDSLNSHTRASDEENLESVTQPNDPCSHCMMHSQTNSNYSLRAGIENSASYQIIAAGTATTLSTPASPTPKLVEVHDHGPPGSIAPLYVLVSSFRI
jgi:hypothetical protein